MKPALVFPEQRIDVLAQSCEQCKPLAVKQQTGVIAGEHVGERGAVRSAGITYRGQRGKGSQARQRPSAQFALGERRRYIDVRAPSNANSQQCRRAQPSRLDVRDSNSLEVR